MEKKIYRCFLDRHYIAVVFFDIESDTATHARRDAIKAANSVFPDVRAIAVDNGWIPDEPLEIANLGSSAAPFEVKLVLETKDSKVYVDVDSPLKELV
jgi:hypothetical protein